MKKIIVPVIAALVLAGTAGCPSDSPKPKPSPTVSCVPNRKAYTDPKNKRVHWICNERGDGVFPKTEPPALPGHPTKK